MSYGPLVFHCVLFCSGSSNWINSRQWTHSQVFFHALYQKNAMLCSVSIYKYRSTSWSATDLTAQLIVLWNPKWKKGNLGLCCKDWGYCPGVELLIGKINGITLYKIPFPCFCEVICISMCFKKINDNILVWLRSLLFYVRSL